MLEKNGAPGSWVQEFPAAITVTDSAGIILEMNEKARVSFGKEGGARLIGRNILDCHPEPARSKVARLLETRERNVYTIEKNGVRKMIYQSPWYEGGEYRGLVEISLEVPGAMPHFLRQP